MPSALLIHQPGKLILKPSEEKHGWCKVFSSTPTFHMQSFEKLPRNSLVWRSTFIGTNLNLFSVSHNVVEGVCPTHFYSVAYVHWRLQGNHLITALLRSCNSISGLGHNLDWVILTPWFSSSSVTLKVVLLLACWMTQLHILSLLGWEHLVKVYNPGVKWFCWVYTSQNWWHNNRDELFGDFVKPITRLWQYWRENIISEVKYCVGSVMICKCCLWTWAPCHHGKENNFQVYPHILPDNITEALCQLMLSRSWVMQQNNDPKTQVNWLQCIFMEKKIQNLIIFCDVG